MKNRKPKKLIYEYISITIIIGMILIVSFFLILQISNTSTIQQAKLTSEIIFQQAIEQLLQVEEDVDNLRFNLIQDESLQNFMESQDLNIRWESMESISWLVGANRRINRNLENIVLYDSDNNLYFSLGDVYFPKYFQDSSTTIRYSSALKHPKTNAIYYEVEIPVIDNNDMAEILGTISLLFNTHNIQSIVAGALLNNESAIALLDKNNNIIVADGKWNKDYNLLGTVDLSKSTDLKESMDSIINCSYIGKTGWRLVSVVPKKGLLFGVERLSWIIYVTFIAVIVTMLFLCISIYKRVIYPIIQQTVFMDNFTQDTKQRLTIYSNNEIGLMALKMNQMLDDIESLNDEIIESEKRYLQVKYAKKRTEIIAYKSQINPHFLYNTLECMRGMALYRGEKDIADIALTLSELFRFSIKGDEVVTVLECLNNLNRYAKIIEYRFMGKYQIHIEAKRDTFHYKMPKLLLQPLLENAVLHGLETKVENGYVNVIIEQKNNFLSATIEDNGIGIDPLVLEQILDSMKKYDEMETISDNDKSIGVLNVYRRMRLFYGNSATFTIESQLEKGTKITLELPFLEEKLHV